MAISVPDYVSEAAKRGLAWHAEGKSGDGVTEKTLREARDMADGSVSEDKLRRMGPWFQRHRGDMDAPKNKPDNEDFPGAGAVAWALWGGPTSGDIMRTAKWAESKVAQLDADKTAKILSKAQLALPENNAMPHIVSDIDGTILKNGQRVEKVIAFLDEAAEEVTLLTNRPESDRESTVKELADAGIEYDDLIMNDTGAAAPEFKSGIIKAMLDDGERVDLFVDNDAANRNAVAKLGVEVMAPEDVPDVVEEEDSEEEAKVAIPGILKMTIEEQLVSAASNLAGITAERDDLRATVEKLTVGAAAELESLKVEAAAKDAKLVELTAALEAAAKEGAELKAKVAELEAGKVSASKEAAKIAASVGVAPVAMSPADSAPAAEAVDHLAAFLALPVGSKERNEYFAAHKAAIVRAAF